MTLAAISAAVTPRPRVVTFTWVTRLATAEGCLKAKVKVEGEGVGLVVGSSPSPTVEWSNFLCTPTTNIYDFTFKQPSADSSRMNFAKVTTRGRGNSAAEIAAEVTRPGVALILR